MKTIYYFLIFLCPLITYAQTHPLDTTFYSEGIIKSIRFDRDYKYSGNAIKRTFKKSANYLDQNLPLFDTMFRNDYATKKDWTHYDGSTRLFLNKFSNVYVSKSTKHGYGKDSIFSKITGRYDFRFGDMGNLELTLAYNKDTLITAFFLCRYDSIQSNKIQDYYISTRYDKAKFATSYQTYFCQNHGDIELYFKPNNLIHTFEFFPKDTSELGIFYEFQSSFLCKQFGKVKGNVKVGEWIEYHLNGNIAAIGNYKMFDKKTPTNSYSQDIDCRLYYIKEGSWKFFNEDGSLIKILSYKNGIPSNEQNFKNGKINTPDN